MLLHSELFLNDKGSLGEHMLKSTLSYSILTLDPVSWFMPDIVSLPGYSSPGLFHSLPISNWVPSAGQRVGCQALASLLHHPHFTIIPFCSASALQHLALEIYKSTSPIFICPFPSGMNWHPWLPLLCNVFNCPTVRCDNNEKPAQVRLWAQVTEPNEPWSLIANWKG